MIFRSSYSWELNWRPCHIAIANMWLNN
jgi:hypothetical protein